MLSPKNSLALYAMKIAENNMNEAKKIDEETNSEIRSEKIQQAEREKKAAEELLKGNIEGAFSSLCYFRDR
jgi:hypothetical protein